MMKTELKNKQNRLLKWASKGLKYFLLALLGCAIAFVVSHAFNIVFMIKLLQSLELWTWFFRIAVFLFCLFAIAMMIESWG
ncbi:hypothetical protein [Halotia branconii]|uniref:Uncharacterized protein n=1 Tax=Halotia branconii CENA392 TaxID=1539056 RepID=A0AAJ6NVH3_9CYAN|nr:hypothetical protein [Halotia branconii]WGV27263.1 hypothetical protein QI031_07180 [Halotia branconii CENA392]